MKYERSMMPSMKNEARHLQELEGHKAYPKTNHRARRLYLACDFLERDCAVEDHPAGLLIDGRYVIAISRNRWRVDGRGTWYWYSSPEQFVEEYITRHRPTKNET